MKGLTEISSFFVAGLVFSDVDVNALKLKQGARLTLVKEPENEHDEEAIRIEHKGKKLGYVPARFRDTGADQLRDAIDNGTPVRVTVKQHARTNPTHRQILVGAFVRERDAVNAAGPVKTF